MKLVSKLKRVSALRRSSLAVSALVAALAGSSFASAQEQAQDTDVADAVLTPVAAAPFAMANSIRVNRARKLWKAWLASRPAPCDPAMDSQATFNPNSNKVAIVLHGLGSGPLGVAPIAREFVSRGYSVLVPRLSGHFDADLTSLDQVSASDWVRDSEDVFAIARAIGPQVTLVGYSLGGLLAGRLAVEYSDRVDRAVFFAPAWRINPTISLGSLVGSIIGTSLNEFQNIPVACRLDSGYVPARAGREIEDLTMSVESEFGSTYTLKRPTASVLARMRVPHLLIAPRVDEAVDGAAISQMCGWSRTCNEVIVDKASHVSLLRRLHTTPSGAPPSRGRRAPSSERTLAETLGAFVN